MNKTQEEMLREILQNPELRQEKVDKVMEYFTNGMKDGFVERGIDFGGGADQRYEDYDCTRFFCMTEPIPFSHFSGIRKSIREVKLAPNQEENVLKAFDVLVRGDSNQSANPGELAHRVSDPLPFVSVLFDQLCPDFPPTDKSGPRSGATYLLLSAFTGHLGLCTRCLEAGANVNNMSFLMEDKHDPDEMFHGYSPLFIAVLAEQFEIMEEMTKYGGSLHIYDRWGRTPLHAAVTMGNKDLVQWIVAKGAPRFVSDSYNYLPADCSSFAFASDRAVIDLLVPPYTTKPEEVVEKRAKRPLCHCHSGLRSGYCGCVDDMYCRWSMDRHNAKWGAGVDFAALAELQKSAPSKRQ
ncbi:Ankyrin repeats (3 copies)/Ankyrin repeat, putative [Angomonas deanei]|uniref:Ankyrin repeats (3 copies)/Ankyrin repeat, putative n=1 Tax=Angomonas deanei TaxID=59799 RepID=A0A7G2C6G5_9TRYP|nr:Ankyrin repeats (3 copies)/Ankyrin repeat, putative [Angomonas deanei]